MVRVSPDRTALAVSQKHAFWVVTRDGTARMLTRFGYGDDYRVRKLYERLLEDPSAQMRELFRACNLAGFDEGKLLGLLEKPALGKWRRYADDDWFRRHEESCEKVLRDFFRQEFRPGR